MALSQSDLDALDAAIASSELEVQLDGRRVRYRSLDELLKARAHVAQVLAASAQGPASTRRRYRFAFTTYRGG
jgi:ABC-type cobalamin transport system ATPase subunit